MLNIKFSNKFKKELHLVEKRGKDPKKLQELMSLLVKKEVLPDKYKDHKLKSNFLGYRECHLEPDWLVVYRILEDNNIVFERTGTHSDLFKK